MGKIIFKIPSSLNFLLLLFCLFSASCYRTGSPNTNSNGVSADNTATTVIQDPPPVATPPLNPQNGPVADPTCLTDSQGNACVFMKSPVAQKNAALADNSSASAEIVGLQTYSVQIANTNGTNLFDDSLVSVRSHDGTQVAAVGGKWKFAYSAANAGKLSQVLAFYWINYAALTIETNTGVSWAKNKHITVVSDDAFSGWSSPTNSIHLEYNTAALPAVFDAGILLHFFGAANAHYASQGAINDFSLDQANASCTPSGSVHKQHFCCKSANGCSRALQIGIGDYFNAMIFPSTPTLGETLTNQITGFSHCNFSRDLRQHTNSTASDAYSACTSLNASGQIYTMGTLYASIWWELRKQAENAKVGGSKDIDRLFMLHLQLLHGEDTFLTALGKILLADQQNFQSGHDLMIRQEFQRRGLTGP